MSGLGRRGDALAGLSERIREEAFRRHVIYLRDGQQDAVLSTSPSAAACASYSLDAMVDDCTVRPMDLHRVSVRSRHNMKRIESRRDARRVVHGFGLRGEMISQGIAKAVIEGGQLHRRCAPRRMIDVRG